MSLTFDAVDAAWWPYLFILIAGGLATDIWRWLGVLAGNRLRDDSEALIWVRAVATALVASVIGKLILFPTGALAAAPLLVRLAAAAAGFAAFSAARQSVFAGVVAGEAVLIAGWWRRGGTRGRTPRVDWPGPGGHHDGKQSAGEEQRLQGRRLQVRDPEDLVAGLLFVVIGLGALVIALGYPMGTGTRMGPGYFPSVLGGLLALLGLAIVVKSLGMALPDDVAEERQAGLAGDLLRLLRPLFFVAAALISFAYLLPRYGLVLAVITLVLVSAFADHKPRLLTAIPLAGLLAAVVVLVFVRGLGLPIRVWP